MSPTAKQTTRTNSISSLFSSESFDAVTLLLLLFTGSTLGFSLFFFQRHNWAEIMGNIWNRTCAAVFAYCVPSRLFSRMHFEYFLRCCFSRTNMKTFFFFFLQYLFVKGRLQGHVFHSTCSPGGKEDDNTGV